MAKAYAMIPVYLAVPALFWLVFWSTGFPMYWAAFGLGALGWWLAYVLRIPIGLVLKKWSKQPNNIVYFSGPLEEGVRVIVLLMTGTSLHWALSLGQGWAAVEVVFTIVTVISLTSLKYRTDEKAIQAKEILREAGTDLDGSPLWGVMERIFASGLHIGSALLIAWNPWLAIVMAGIHTGTNVILVRLMKKSAAIAELVLAVLGSIVLIAGLLVYSF